MSHDEHLAEIIAASSVGREIDPAKLLALLRPLFSRPQHGPRLTPTQLRAYQDLTSEERDVLIRCLEVLRAEISEISSRR